MVDSQSVATADGVAQRGPTSSLSMKSQTVTPATFTVVLRVNKEDNAKVLGLSTFLKMCLTFGLKCLYHLVRDALGRGFETRLCACVCACEVSKLQ